MKQKRRRKRKTTGEDKERKTSIDAKAASYLKENEGENSSM